MSDGVVTVAIPVLNGAAFLDEVLAAVRAQRVEREVELLVVDSGSTDGSLEIAGRFDARMVEIRTSEYRTAEPGTGSWSSPEATTSRF